MSRGISSTWQRNYTTIIDHLVLNHREKYLHHVKEDREPFFERPKVQNSELIHPVKVTVWHLMNPADAPAIEGLHGQNSMSNLERAQGVCVVVKTFILHDNGSLNVRVENHLDRVLEEAKVIRFVDGGERSDPDRLLGLETDAHCFTIPHPHA